MSRTSRRERQRLFEEESLIAEGTELIAQLLEAQGVSRQELAARLGKSKGFVSQLLSGERNMTLRTVAALGFALGTRVELSHSPLSAPRKYVSVAKKLEGPHYMRDSEHRRRGERARKRTGDAAPHLPKEDAPQCSDQNHSFSLAG